MQTQEEFGVLHILSGQIFEGFKTETDALAWLGRTESIKINNCEVVRREIVWSDWERVHKNGDVT